MGLNGTMTDDQRKQISIFWMCGDYRDFGFFFSFFFAWNMVFFFPSIYSVFSGFLRNARIWVFSLTLKSKFARFSVGGVLCTEDSTQQIVLFGFGVFAFFATTVVLHLIPYDLIITYARTTT
jgi:hypothetical protein